MDEITKTMNAFVRRKTTERLKQLF